MNKNKVTHHYVAMRSLLLFCFVFGAAMAGVCPPPGEISPCSCRDLGSDGLVIQLDCRSASLDDAKASQILDTMLSWPGVSPLRLLDMLGNRLTRVPSQLPQFVLLNSIDLSNNLITNVEANAFNFSTATLASLSLSSNSISSIQEGAFQGNYGNSIVNLQYTSLTRFESGVFQPMLEKIEPYYTGSSSTAYVDIYRNQIDCTTDRCHMAWLILYNRQLLKVIRNAQCSNGQSFSNLDRNLYTNCPFVCPSTSNGFYPDPESCITYYNCDNGITKLQTCPIDGDSGEQLIFDPVQRQCDKAANTPGCSIKPFLCPSTSGYFPNPNSCHTYYRCINDVPYLLDCGQLVYNPSNQQCDLTGCVITTSSSASPTGSTIFD